jgi:hypothetical protein
MFIFRIFQLFPPWRFMCQNQRPDQCRLPKAPKQMTLLYDWFKIPTLLAARFYFPLTSINHSYLQHHPINVCCLPLFAPLFALFFAPLFAPLFALFLHPCLHHCLHCFLHPCLHHCLHFCLHCCSSFVRPLTILGTRGSNVNRGVFFPYYRSHNGTLLATSCHQAMSRGGVVFGAVFFLPPSSVAAIHSFWRWRRRWQRRWRIDPPPPRSMERNRATLSRSVMRDSPGISGGGGGSSKLLLSMGLTRIILRAFADSTEHDRDFT